MSAYTIKRGRYAGTVLEVGRIPRQAIDRFIGDHPEPDVPKRPADELGVEVWADPHQLMDDLHDPGYVEAKAAWDEAFGQELFDLLVEAVSVPEGVKEEAEIELEDLLSLALLPSGSKASLMSAVLLSSREDLEAIVDLVMYNSTVTVRGLVKAARLYGVHRDGKKVPVLEDGKGKVTANGAFGDRMAMVWYGMTDWETFCALPGPQQSEIVALYRYKVKLEELAFKG